jgi:hypothetical protein
MQSGRDGVPAWRGDLCARWGATFGRALGECLIRTSARAMVRTRAVDRFEHPCHTHRYGCDNVDQIYKAGEPKAAPARRGRAVTGLF